MPDVGGAAELLALMERTDPKDWPSPRGYGYRGSTGERVKSWHLYVIREFVERLVSREPSDA